MHEFYIYDCGEMKIEYYENFFASLSETTNQSWQANLYNSLINIFEHPSHGDYKKWENAVTQIPDIPTTKHKFNQPVVQVGEKSELNKSQQQALEHALLALVPWRKGPFNLYGIEIDAEWRCEQKWVRLQSHLPDLNNKRILDVGCGNGYYMLRMLGTGAHQVIGVEPSLLFMAQFTAITKNIKPSVNAYLIPLEFEKLPHELNNFDYVFSMGVLYHRRDPHQHLKLLFQHTAPGGIVYLETLIVEEYYQQELIPKNRYAGMRNVWSVPCSNLVQTWLSNAGFINCTLLNTHATSVDEQRATCWMPYHSLRNSLDPMDHTKTIEGYPAPLRAIFCAYKPLS